MWRYNSIIHFKDGWRAFVSSGKVGCRGANIIALIRAHQHASKVTHGGGQLPPAFTLEPPMSQSLRCVFDRLAIIRASTLGVFLGYLLMLLEMKDLINRWCLLAAYEVFEARLKRSALWCSQIFDGLVVLGTFVTYITMTTVSNDSTTTTVAYLLTYVIALRLWRIGRIYSGELISWITMLLLENVCYGHTARRKTSEAATPTPNSHRQALSYKANVHTQRSSANWLSSKLDQLYDANFRRVEF